MGSSWVYHRYFIDGSGIVSSSVYHRYRISILSTSHRWQRYLYRIGSLWVYHRWQLCRYRIGILLVSVYHRYRAGISGVYHRYLLGITSVVQDLHLMSSSSVSQRRQLYRYHKPKWWARSGGNAAYKFVGQNGFIALRKRGLQAKVVGKGGGRGGGGIPAYIP